MARDMNLHVKMLDCFRFGTEDHFQYKSKNVKKLIKSESRNALVPS